MLTALEGDNFFVLAAIEGNLINFFLCVCLQRSLYNLNDDEEDDLTHGGVPLKDLKSLKGPLDSDGELEEDGMLDGKDLTL